MLSKSIFTIGVTGHRDIRPDTIPELKLILDEQFKLYKKKLPQTEIRLISLVADGADRLAASVALDNDISVEAIFPMPKNIYFTDFSNESRKELVSILDNPLVTIKELPLPNNISPKDTSLTEIRGDLYLRAGKFMVSNSDLVIALWDGKQIEKIGGTYHIIKTTIQNITIVGEMGESITGPTSYKFSLRDFATTSVYHIPTTRSSSTSALLSKSPAFIIRSDNEHDVIKHSRETPKELQQLISQINNYEKDVSDCSKNMPSQYENGELVDISLLNSSRELHSYLEEIEGYYNSTDRLAQYFQKKSDNAFKVMSFLAFSLGSIFLIYAELIPIPAVLLVYVLLFIIGYLLYKKFKKSHCLEKHVKYRVMAEALRVKYFFTLASIQNINDDYAIERFLKLNENKDFKVLTSFIRNSTNSVFNTNNTENIPERIKLTISEWVGDQEKYFKVKSAKAKKQLQRLKISNSIIIILCLVLVFGLFFLPASFSYYKIANLITIKNILTFFIGFMPLAIAACEHFSIKMALTERAWQYNTMAAIFSRANLLLHEASSIEQYQAILKSLGEEAIEENMQWMVLRLQRELQPATGS